MLLSSAEIFIYLFICIERQYQKCNIDIFVNGFNSGCYRVQAHTMGA